MSKEFNFNDIIRCYFFGNRFPKENRTEISGITGFAIPDLGIVFRSRYNGTLFECQYAGLLALLKFLKSNLKNFQGKQFEIFSDSAVVVYQITHKKFVSDDLKTFYRSVLHYQKKIPFELSWIPINENTAITGLAEMAPLSSDSKLDYNIEVKDNKKELGKGYI